MRLPLTKYGRREWLLASIILAAGIITSIVLASPKLWSLLAVVPMAALWAWVLYFFRDPNREGPASKHVLVSPADGRVTDITPIGPDSPLGTNGIKIGVFMSVFNVHVNRSPGACIVQRVEHQHGVFLDARNPLASERNESATIYLRCSAGTQATPLVVRQVAGLVARRIVTDLSPGQQLSRSERIGMIKFGSRVELMVPQEVLGDVLVTLGQRVQAGQTAMVSLKQ